MEDDGPYEPQGELGVSICNVIISDVHQLDLGLDTKKGNIFRDLSINPSTTFFCLVTVCLRSHKDHFALPVGASGNPGLSVRSAACGIACGLSHGAADTRAARGRGKNRAEVTLAGLIIAQ